VNLEVLCVDVRSFDQQLKYAQELRALVHRPWLARSQLAYVVVLKQVVHWQGIIDEALVAQPMQRSSDLVHDVVGSVRNPPRSVTIAV
jgi:hypothetical protein